MVERIGGSSIARVILDAQRDPAAFVIAVTASTPREARSGQLASVHVENIDTDIGISYPVDPGKRWLAGFRQDLVRRRFDGQRALRRVGPLGTQVTD